MKEEKKETIETYMTFANTTFSGHPNISDLIDSCKNDVINFKKTCEQHIKGNFDIPTELQNDIEVLKYIIDVDEVFTYGGNYLIFDIECYVTLNIKSSLDDIKEKINQYHKENNDLRWNISIKWQDSETDKVYLFDDWDNDFIEDIIYDQPFFENENWDE